MRARMVAAGVSVLLPLAVSAQGAFEVVSVERKHHERFPPVYGIRKDRLEGEPGWGHQPCTP